MVGVKYSRQRESIIRNLRSRTDHPTADMVYADIRAVYPKISLGTVYRNLSLLTDLGEIQKISTSDGADRFDGNAAPHDHFCCKNCGSVYDLFDDSHEDLINRACHTFPGDIDGCSVTFYGTCEHCKKPMS